MFGLEVNKRRTVWCVWREDDEDEPGSLVVMREKVRPAIWTGRR